MRQVTESTSNIWWLVLFCSISPQPGDLMQTQEIPHQDVWKSYESWGSNKLPINSLVGQHSFQHHGGSPREFLGILRLARSFRGCACRRHCSIISKIDLKIVRSWGISISLRLRSCTSLMDTLNQLLIYIYMYILVAYTHPRYCRILATNNASCDCVAD